ncbi:Factor arrest protein 11 [Coniosporium tulheliwenetii]|uniref:Factor arrest protein 11 n=1 Tax=Coniosporium tulheliwenetii TaxID=3383036 RepID=A0ACC2Z3P8_9PEZI|nr:Factor arrest protein 11 [Cladosporium sp. JES 115]
MSSSEEIPAPPSTLSAPSMPSDADATSSPSAVDIPSTTEPAIQPGMDTADLHNLDGVGTRPAQQKDSVALPARPILRRDKSVPFTGTSQPKPFPPAPAPPGPSSNQQPGPSSTMDRGGPPGALGLGAGSLRGEPGSIQQGNMGPGNPEDSLSLMQLRKLVTEIPRIEPTPYAFEYADAQGLPEEVEEWFGYGVEERAMLLKAQTSWADVWGDVWGERGQGEEWIEVDEGKRREFVEILVEGIGREEDDAERLRCLEALVYLALGWWGETAGLEDSTAQDVASEEAEAQEDQDGGTDSAYAKSAVQIAWVKRNVQMMYECNGVQPIYDLMRAALARACLTDNTAQSASVDGAEAERREMWCTLTLMYVLLEVARTNGEESGIAISKQIATLEPNLLTTLTEFVARLRWDESLGLPLNKLVLLTWKAILVSFGGIPEVDKAKASFVDETLETADKRGQPLITASPLDYHVFRQEISSKYPAYNPPPPLFPLEPESNSILPPLKNHSRKTSQSSTFSAGLANLNGSGVSILHQPVHIATPAPSPPPSPAGPGGKGGKKQNYQTNQLFPFLYPPLDASSNNLGGKGTTDLQDVLVGRKWEGADIPTSILEAAELFAKRMRATRAMKQLWEERVQFMRYERGWTGPGNDGDVEAFELEERPVSPKGTEGAGKEPEFSADPDVDARLRAVELFYKNSLPHLQSVVIVLMRIILAHVTRLFTENGQMNGQNGLQSNFQFQENLNGNGAGKPEMNGAGSSPIDVDTAMAKVDAVRQEEIMMKAVTGIMVLLLKWFKVDHILKFEYLTQLLVDSNYIPLILKLLQTQELEKAINYRCDREDLNFFNFCLSHSRHGAPSRPPSSPSSADSSSSDEAAPPPIIKRHRSPPRSTSPTSPRRTTSTSSAPPEVDELGFPITELPQAPITTYSWRSFFTAINTLRILQKICKRKAHRNLLLVQYKSSIYLKKCLRIPQPTLRLYALKLFKNQVPYCGRKWRQGNMRVITAVYLHVRPELREEWLTGGDVDREVDESLGVEQAGRALVHWGHLRRYPQQVGAGRGLLGGG